jgi:hypothetical protein
MRTPEGSTDIFIIENEQTFTVPNPAALDPYVIYATERRIWENQVDEYVKRDIKLNENCEKLYSPIFGQYMEYMWAKLESIEGYEAMIHSLNAVVLIKAIKGLAYKLEGQSYHAKAIHRAKKRLYTFTQQKDTMNAKFLKLFEMHVSVVAQ